MKNWTDEQKLAAVKASPAAVARHDKTTWLSLFASDGQVNDPVGSKPHNGEAEISRFYDTFIAPNDIRFIPDHDIVCGDTVVRDLVISTTMSTGLQVDVSTHIRYELVEEGGQLRVRRLYAHWELMPMVMQTLGKGATGWTTYSKLSLHMIRCQGMGGVMGFMRGFGGVGAAGKRRAESIFAALAAGQQPADLPGGWTGDACPGLQWRKVIASGKFVTATVEQGGRRGVALLEFDRNKKPQNLKFYWPA